MLHGTTVSIGESAEDFVDGLQRYAQASRAVNHPLLEAISAGTFRNLPYVMTLFLREYYAYGYRFTQFLAAVMSRLEDPEHRARLLPNVMEEGGYITEEHAEELRHAGLAPEDVSAPHPVLMRRFLAAIGLSEAQSLCTEPHVATTAWTTTLDATCRLGSQQQAIGALGLGTEGIVRLIYVKLLVGIKRAWPELSLRDRAFFELHALVDDEHAEVMRGITIDLCQTPEGRREVALGVLQALSARSSFFDHMLMFLREMDLRQEPAA